MRVFFIFIILWNFESISVHAHSVSTDHCNGDNYTEEVSKLECSSKYIEFRSKGLPAAKHALMLGIQATNQQFPTEHDYQFKIMRNPKHASKITMPDAGPIGVAVNGIPIFDPATQGKIDKKTGKRPHTLLVGELDECGGHAGRGDDYHYHVAPSCLIEQLGPDHVEKDKKPIGFAKDGYPILALGWFNNENNIEQELDECRGYRDSNGTYFYNVMSVAKWDILDCFSGKPSKFAKDKWTARKDKNGNDIVGYPVKFKVEDYSHPKFDSESCHIMTGTIPKEQLLMTSGKTKKIKNKSGTLFYCNSQCYGMFFEADKKSHFKGRVIYYDLVEQTCPNSFSTKNLSLFEAYRGPDQKYKAPQETKK